MSWNKHKRKINGKPADSVDENTENAEELETGEYDDIEDVIPPDTVKLSSLKLKVGDKMELEYDYGAGWTFDIELISIEPMVKGTGTHYPYITDDEIKALMADDRIKSVNAITNLQAWPIGIEGVPSIPISQTYNESVTKWLTSSNSPE